MAFLLAAERNTAVIVSNLDSRWRKVVRFTHQPGDWLGLKAGLVFMEKNKFYSVTNGSTYGREQ